MHCCTVEEQKKIEKTDTEEDPYYRNIEIREKSIFMQENRERETCGDWL